MKIILVLAEALWMGAYAHGDCCPYDSDYFYAQVSGGANFIKIEKEHGIKPHLRTGYVVSGALGYHWHRGLSLEAEYAYRRSSQSSFWYYGQSFRIPGHFWSSSYMANALLDLPLCDLWPVFERFLPFLGGGVGYDVQHLQAHAHEFVWRRSDKGFAWQLIAGLSYEMMYNTAFGLVYKFHKGPISAIDNHSLEVGFTYKFGCCKQECCDD